MTAKIIYSNGYQYDKPIESNKNLESDVVFNGIYGLYRCRKCGELYGNVEIVEYKKCRKCGAELQESEKK